MPDEYEKGKEVGGIEADIKNIRRLLESHIEKQDDFNKAIDKRVQIAEAWIQTTTGKVAVLTAIFSGVGWIMYEVVKWWMNHK